MNPLAYWILVLLSWFVLSIALHEIGHFFVAKLMKLKTNFGVDKKSLFVHVFGASEIQHETIGLGGVVFGLIPTFFMFNEFGLFVGGMCLVAYITGAWNEIKYVSKSFSEVEDEK